MHNPFAPYVLNMTKVDLLEDEEMRKKLMNQEEIKKDRYYTGVMDILEEFAEINDMTISKKNMCVGYLVKKRCLNIGHQQI